MNQIQLRLQQARVIGILRTTSAETALEAALSAVRAGLEVLELTFTTPDVMSAITALRKDLPSHVLLGVGSVITPEQAKQACAAQLDFMVSPHLDPQLLDIAQTAQIPYFPGVLTPSEIAAAWRLGARVLKVFPIGAMGGEQYLRDLRGPFPELQAIVTGGISPTQVKAYLEAGALAVGLGTQLFPKIALQNHDWQAVEQATRSALETIKS